jgi:hypothetical protein
VWSADGPPTPITPTTLAKIAGLPPPDPLDKLIKSLGDLPSVRRAVVTIVTVARVWALVTPLPPPPQAPLDSKTDELFDDVDKEAAPPKSVLERIVEHATRNSPGYIDNKVYERLLSLYNKVHPPSPTTMNFSRYQVWVGGVMLKGITESKDAGDAPPSAATKGENEWK